MLEVEGERGLGNQSVAIAKCCWVRFGRAVSELVASGVVGRWMEATAEGAGQ